MPKLTHFFAHSVSEVQKGVPDGGQQVVDLDDVVPLLYIQQLETVATTTGNPARNLSQCLGRQMLESDVSKSMKRGAGKLRWEICDSAAPADDLQFHDAETR